jgi:signal transduction histidine kinase
MIRHHRAWFLSAMGLVSLFAFSASAATADEAKTLAERAAAHVKDVGRDKAFADFSKPDGGFVNGELYVFCQDKDGTVVAHGGNPAIVGKNMLNVKDPDGKAPNAAMNDLGLTKGEGWYDFRWPNPETKRIQEKSAYVIKIDDHTICGSGYYK